MYRIVKRKNLLAYCEIESTGFHIRIEKTGKQSPAVTEISGGNSRLDPESVVPSDSPLRLPLKSILLKCKRTAKQLLENNYENTTQKSTADQTLERVA